MQVHDEPGPLTLSAPGAITTEFHPSGSSDVIVPWLIVTGLPTEFRLPAPHGSDVPLQALADDERLVAVADDGPIDAASLFSDAKIVSVRLDLSRTLLEPAQAWESLDAIVLSSTAARRVTDEQRQVLLAAGVALAIRSLQPPDTRWPWVHRGEYWVLRHPLAGPNHVVEPAAYGPTYGWCRGWPLVFRRQILLVAAVFILLTLGLRLWRTRIAILVMLAFCALAWGMLLRWYGQQSAVLTLSAGVMISDGRVAQVDLWHWLSPVRAANATFPAGDLCHPILPDPNHAGATRLRLLCRGDGRPESFEFHLEARQSLAFMTRLLQPNPSQPALVPAAELFRSFAQDVYLGSDQAIAGQFQATDPETGASVPVVLVAPRPRD